MLIERSRRVEKVDDDFIAECVVYDNIKNKEYYVTIISGYMYGTYESSYIDYRLKINKNYPKVVEEVNCFWWNTPESEKEPFNKFYNEMDDLVDIASKEYSDKIHYSTIKLLNNINYEIISKRCNSTTNNPKDGNEFEIKVHVLDDDSILYLYLYDEPTCKTYIVSKISVLDYRKRKNKKEDDDFIIELVFDYKITKSEYNDLYIELDKYRDGY